MGSEMCIRDRSGTEMFNEAMTVLHIYAPLIGSGPILGVGNTNMTSRMCFEPAHVPIADAP